MVCPWGIVLIALHLLSYLLCTVTLCNDNILEGIGIPHLAAGVFISIGGHFLLTIWCLATRWQSWLQSGLDASTRTVTPWSIFKGCGFHTVSKTKTKRNAPNLQVKGWKGWWEPRTKWVLHMVTGRQSLHFTLWGFWCWTSICRISSGSTPTHCSTWYKGLKMLVTSRNAKVRWL